MRRTDATSAEAADQRQAWSYVESRIRIGLDIARSRIVSIPRITGIASNLDTLRFVPSDDYTEDLSGNHWKKPFTWPCDIVPAIANAIREGG